MVAWRKASSLLAGLLVAVATLIIAPGAAGAAGANTTSPPAAALVAQAAAASQPLCAATPPPPAPAPGVGTIKFRFNQDFLLALAKAGVIVHAAAPGQTSVCLRPISVTLTLPLQPMVIGPGSITAKIDGEVVFRRLSTGATLPLSLYTFSHRAAGFYVLVSSDAPLTERVLFSVGSQDSSGAYPLFLRPEAINIPLGTAFAFQGQAGTLFASYPPA